MPQVVLTAEQARGVAVEPTMHPVTIDGCFGWLHAQIGAPASDLAVLICADLTNDRLNAHRPLRQFADLLAANSYPTLRFDYPDTGNAADLGETEHWSLWQRSVTTAADWLREHTGARRVVFVGVRAGAMLAALAAERRDDVAGLLLLEPVLRGQSFVRQISFARHFRNASAGADGLLDVHGLRLSADTIARMAAVDMRAIVPPHDCPIVVYSRSSSPVLTRFVDAWRGFGARISSEDLGDLDPLLRPTFMNHEMSANFTRPLQWLRQHAPAAPMPFDLLPVPDYVPLRAEHWIELPYRFGVGERLFGVLCRPIAGESPGSIVIIVNASGNPCAGDSRQAVGLARRFAREGIASLRMDFAGIGDSPSPGKDREVPMHIMEVDRTDDIGAALDALQRDGFSRFAVEGLCVGAYHAMHAAFADRRVGALLLVNMPLFTWRKGDRIETVSARVTSQYLRIMIRPATWARFLRRQIDLAYPLFRLRTAFMLSATAAMRRAVRGLGWTMPLSAAQRGMETLWRRGVRTQLLYASEDVGIEILEREFGRGGRDFRDADIRILADLDHSLLRAETQHVAADCMVTFLKQAWRG